MSCDDDHSKGLATESPDRWISISDGNESHVGDNRHFNSTTLHLRVLSTLDFTQQSHHANSRRYQPSQERRGQPRSELCLWQRSQQTSIMAVQFDGGVVIGADSRTTTGSYIVSDRYDVTHLRPTESLISSRISMTGSIVVVRDPQPTRKPSPTPCTSIARFTLPSTATLRLLQLSRHCSRGCATRTRIN